MVGSMFAVRHDQGIHFPDLPVPGPFSERIIAGRKVVTVDRKSRTSFKC